MAVRLFVLLAIFLCCSTSYAGEAVEIPLSEIWALDMPGTKDVRELDPHKDVENKSAISKIGRSLVYRTSERAKAGPCFLVIGEGKEALLNAAKVIVDGALPAKVLPTEKKLSLVFYSYSAPGYVHLHSVSRTGSQLTVKYQIVTHRSADVTVHFALIPLGMLPAGKIAVQAVEEPTETPYEKHDRTAHAVCDSSTFIIQHEGAQP